WYFSKPSAASGTEEILDNGHILMPLDAYSRWTRFYEMDWLGKVYWSYANPESMNHDAAELPNGNILTICGGDLVELERGTGREVKRIRYEDYFKNEGSLEVRTKGDYDWFHENTVIYHEGDVIISARNQHMVLKLDYETEKLEWILGSNAQYQPKQKKHYLTPEGEDFEWFYSQHQPSILPDLDQNPDTMDILLFDNGAHRSYEEATSIAPDEMYSRIVHYRIDEKAKTVEQVWDAGKSLGLPYYSEIHSGAQYLEDSGNYLGAFDASSSYTMATWTDFFSNAERAYTSKIVEFAPSGEILHQIEVEAPIYRAYRMKTEEMSTGFSALGEVKGTFNVTDEVEPKMIPKVGHEGNVIADMVKVSYNAEHLETVGWAYVEGLETVDAKYYLNLVGEKDTYTYPLGRDHRINIPSDRLVEGMEGDVTKGFKEPYLSLEQVKEGSYTLELLVEAEGDTYSTALPYYFTIKDTQGKLVPVTNNLLTQEQLDKRIQASFEKADYTEDAPLVIQDPYQMAPLTALVLFESEKPLKVSLEVEGKDADSTLKYDFKTFETNHSIPVYGLYADTVNKVKLHLTGEAGEMKTTELTMKTQPLPAEMMVPEMKVKREKEMAEGMTFVTSTYTAAIDAKGDVRWYLSDKTIGGGATPIRRLENGHLALMSNRNVAPMYYQTGFYEMDLLGRIYNEYTFQGAHHEIQELPNGNFIVAAEKDSKTTEDYIVELDRETGKVVRSWDLGEILGIEKVADATYQEGNVSDKTLTMAGASEVAIQESADYTSRHDWFHNNAVDYVEEEDALVISGRQQDIVLKIDGDTKEIRWILSDTSDDFPPHLQEKVLKPVGKDFMYQYGQHAAMQLPNGDIMLYDNGNFRSKEVTEAREANDNFSRGVIYRIDEEAMTVEQVWEYGKKRGKELFTPYIGDVDYLAENHYLINFGGILQDKAGNRYNSPVALFTNDAITGIAKVVEIKNDKVISELTLTGPKNANTYRVERMPLYAENVGYTPVGEMAARKGTLRESEKAQVQLPEATAFPHAIQQITDEGDRILVDATFYGSTLDAKAYVVLQKDKKTYAYPMTGNAMNRSVKVNKVGLPAGVYKTGILLEEKGEARYSQTDYRIQVQ
ncbi:MAG: aryl-sulfate sulfotransferase, partial [Cellulosilyticaceae bacterium]